MGKTFFKLRFVLAIVIGIVSVLAIVGLYPIKFMDIQFSAVFQKVIVDFSIVSLTILSVLVLLTFLFGRFYCSLICPFGIMQEFFAAIFKNKKSFNKNYPIKYFIMAIAFGALIGGSAILIRYIDPYTIFSSGISLSLFGIIFIAVIIGLTIYKNRFFVQTSALLEHF